MDNQRTREVHTNDDSQEYYGLELLLRKPSLRTRKKRSSEFLQQMELTEDTTCGIGCIRGEWLQTFAKESVYVFVYGILGCFYGSYFAYFNGTLTTLEKRFKIPSKTMGIIATGSDMMHIFVSPLLSYYTGKGHRPRWVGLGIYTVVVSCILSALPHFIYGAGDSVLEYTKEYGGTEQSFLDHEFVVSNHSKKQLCNANRTTNCVNEGEGMMPTVILFLTQIIQGIGGCLYFTVGTAYMDDNIKKSKTPALISFSYVLRMLGPAFGYWMSSMCLKMFVVPTLTPVISESDPRWIGAWWLGNIFIGFLLFILATLIMMFPKTLPRAAARNALAQQADVQCEKSQQGPANMKDMIATFKRLLMNPIFNFNNLAGAFNVLWYMAYWIFLPKYIETQYRQSASSANFVTGTITLVFSTAGILIAGTVITKYRPRARILAGWNIVIGIVTALCLLSYTFLGCPANDEQSSEMASRFFRNSSQTCSGKCHCDYVMYSPVCSESGETFVSPCHAGCQNSIEVNGSKVHLDCDCIVTDGTTSGKAFDGACPTDCETNFQIFVALICMVTFIGSTGRPSNFLVTLRCVEERDKSVSLGFGLMFLSLFAFIPSPILFGYILDTTCLIWGKTCEGTGNCWIYDSERLRYVMNLTAFSFVGIATFMDVIIWYLVKDLKIFDENDKNVVES
ncbi:UNVERIFIED_CONTAM: hypothetical protein PYX00_010624 [Menopon gallinae]|uniref:Solute carrier organic anion transporter family member n=1 Tax=Menopon gallinae TaxID=328185 RepID=A0AAW2HH26_9NEOP